MKEPGLASLISVQDHSAFELLPFFRVRVDSHGLVGSKSWDDSSLFKTHPPKISAHANRGRNFVARPAVAVRIQFLLGAKVSSIHFYCFMIKLIACHGPVAVLPSDILELRLCCKSAVPTSPCLWV
jgi:hypothetical protein